MEYLGNAEVNKNAKRNRAETIKTLADEKIASIGTLLGILTGKPETDPNTPEHRSFIGDNTEEDADPFTGLIGEKETVIGYGTQVSQTAQTATTLCNSEIAAAKANNKLLKENAEAESDADYESDWRKAVNAYLTASYGQDNTYNDALADIDDLFEQAQNTAFGLHETAVVPSQESFTVQLERLNALFGQAITAIDNGQTISENYLTDPDSDMEVCFVAGTLILMADGTSKPIEEIRPGDMVLAVDHNNPENDTPKPSKVTRFFDNGLKSVVKLLFENQETGEQFEVVCTPSHRFYVVGKGWVIAENLTSGNTCQSANGEPVIFLSHESLDDLQHVYNFEVDEKHTYFIGSNNNNSLCTHNSCGDDNTGDNPSVNAANQLLEQVINQLANTNRRFLKNICKDDYYALIFTHMKNDGHAWLGIVHIEKDLKQFSESRIKEQKYSGWSPRFMGMGENISDHANTNWDAVLWYHISENEYATIKNSMDENPFADKGYDWVNRNCVHWVMTILEQSKRETNRPDKKRV